MTGRKKETSLKEILERKRKLLSEIEAIEEEFEKARDSITESEREEARKEIENFKAEAVKLLKKAEEIADQYDLTFSFSMSGDSSDWYENGEWTNSSSSC